jgi:hypothetical protein
VGIAVGKLKRYESPGIDQILADFIKAGGETLCSEVHKLICSICNKEELPQQWKEYIIVPMYKKGDKTYCNNYQGISLLSTAYKILSTFLLARLIPYVSEIIGDHQCWFHHNRCITYQIFYIWQILEKKWEYNGLVHQLFIDFKEAYNSIKREVLYNILLEFGIPKKLVRRIKMCLNETYSIVRVGKLLSDKFPIPISYPIYSIIVTYINIYDCYLFSNRHVLGHIIPFSLPTCIESSCTFFHHYMIQRISYMLFFETVKFFTVK